MEKIVLLGCGGHAKSVVDTILSENKYEIAGFVDRDGSDFEYLGYRTIGRDDDLFSIYHSGVHFAFICIGFLGKGNVREQLFERLKEIGFTLPVIVDPTAVLAKNILLGEGTYVGKRAIVNANAVIGKMAIINTAAIIEHDCCVEDFTHVAVAGVICGSVHIGKRVFVGANATIIQGISIVEGSMVGAGRVVAHDIAKKSTDSI